MKGQLHSKYTFAKVPRWCRKNKLSSMPAAIGLHLKQNMCSEGSLFLPYVFFLQDYIYFSMVYFTYCI